MALTIPRWIVAVSLGCLLLWFGLAHDHSNRTASAIWPIREFRRPTVTPSQLTGRALGTTNDRLRSLEIRDSVLARAATGHATSFDVRIDREIPAPLRAQLDQAVRARWAAPGAPHAAAVVAAIVLDSTRKPHGYPRRPESIGGAQPVAIFLPRRDDQPCVAMLRWLTLPDRAAPAIRPLVRHAMTSPETIGALLGPCAYDARFGRPGPYIGEWMRETRWQFAHFIDWGATSPPWTSGRDVTESSPPFPQLGATEPTVRALLTAAGVACVAGQPGRCAAALVRSRVGETDSSWSAAAVNASGAPLADFYAAHPTALGPAEGWILSDMVRTLGPERFQRFWSSNAPMPEAFESAAGVSLDLWLRDWAHRTYGVVDIGPRMSAASFASGALVLLLAFGAAVAMERRRRVA